MAVEGGKVTWRSLVGYLIGQFVADGAEGTQEEVAYGSVES